MNLDDIAGIITEAYPIPADTFAHAKWAGDLSDISAALSRQYRKEEAALIRTIQHHNLTSPLFDLKEVYRPYSTVNIPLLKQQKPEVYETAVHVRNADAVSLLGRAEVFALVKAKVGDAISEYEVVTVTDIKKLLSAADASRYIIEGEEFVKLAVVRKDA